MKETLSREGREDGMKIRKNWQRMRIRVEYEKLKKRQETMDENGRRMRGKGRVGQVCVG